MFLTRGYANEDWVEAVERLDLDLSERTALAELIEAVDLPSYVSPASLRRLRLEHEQAFILGTAAVVYGTFLLCGGGRGPNDGEDDRVPAIGESLPLVGRFLDPRKSPPCLRLIARMEQFGKISRGEASLPPLEMPDLPVLPAAPWESRDPPPAQPVPGVVKTDRDTTPAPGRSGPRMATRDLPLVASTTPVQVDDLKAAMFALRAWARDEGLDHPQLMTSIRAVKAGRNEKEIFKLGFGELLMLLPTMSPTTVVDAELEQAGMRALALGVVVFGRLTLARFERKRSAAALATIQDRGSRLQESLDEDGRALQEVEQYASLLLTRVTPSTSPDERIYPGLFELRRDIEAALKPSAIEEIAKATVSGELPAISDANLDAVDPSRTTAAEVISKAHKPVVLRPTIGLALHGLVIWSRGGTFLPEVDKAVRRADLAPGLKEWFERGAGILSVLPPEFDPVDLAEAEVDGPGMVAAAMGTLVYAALVKGANPDDVPDLDTRAAEAAEFATYLMMCIEPEASPLHPGLIRDLEGLKRERDKAVSKSSDAADAEARQTRWKMPAVPIPDLRDTGPLLRIIGAVAVFALALAVGLRFWSNRGPPPPSSYVDIVEVVGMVRTPGEITARVYEFRLGETREDRAYNATALWFRLTSEEQDPALRLRIQSNKGDPIAMVAAGSVTWATR